MKVYISSGVLSLDIVNSSPASILWAKVVTILEFEIPV